MKILLIDADSKIPNLPLMKLSTFHKNNGDSVDLKRLQISYYPFRNRKIHNIRHNYDIIYCSIIFENSIKFISNLGIDSYVSKNSKIIYGGSGYSLSKTLPDKIEKLDCDYSLYPNNDTSYGFISRGCIRKCSFCKVPEKEGKIRQVNNPKDIIKHKKVKFLDNNFLALKNHRNILKQLIDINSKYQFNQGLDIRLIDKENSILLSKLKYIGEYIFAFDNIKIEKIIVRKLKLLKWRADWKLKFFVYCNAEYPINDVLHRIEFLRQNKCLPYIMRDINCWYSPYKNFYNDLASYCNQPGIFKNIKFEDYIETRHTNKKIIKSNIKIFNESK